MSTTMQHLKGWMQIQPTCYEATGIGGNVKALMLVNANNIHETETTAGCQTPLHDHSG